MSRTLVAAVSGIVGILVACVVVNGVARVGHVAAQAAPEPLESRESLVALDVRARNNATERCFAVNVLQARIAHYGEGRLGRARELRLELDLDALDSAELRVYRGSALVSRRRFNGLPETCADRRDAVALSIALALESVIRDLAPAGASNDAPVAPATTEQASSSSGARASSAESDASTVAAEPRESALRTGGAGIEAQREAPQSPSVAATSVTTSDEEEEEDEEEDTPVEDESPTVFSIRLHLGARVLAGALPAPVFAGVLGGELRVDRTFGVEFSAFATAVEMSPLAGGHVRSRLTGGEVLGCYSVGWSGFAAQGCAGVMAAACHAQGRDYPRPFPAATLGWVAGTARLALAWPAEESVSLRLVMQGHASFVRPILRVDGVREDLSPFWLGGSTGLDLVVSFD